MWIVWLVVVLLALTVVFNLAWRWASRKWSLPCPTLLAWSLENPTFERISRTSTTLDRMELRPGQRILEIGPGPGRLLIPAAGRILPYGEAVGIDIQAGMIERLTARAKQANVTNLTAILGDATQPHVPDASFDLVVLCTALGEVPDRPAVLGQAFRALKSGGVLSITEKFGDPHYQSRSTVMRLAEKAGFRLQSIQALVVLHSKLRQTMMAEALQTLKGFSVGKPVVVEETFPLRCSPSELDRFIGGSRRHAAGWISFYWGKPPEELRRSTEIRDAVLAQWLALFEKRAKATTE